MRFHEKRFAQEYDRRLTAEKYPGILLDRIAGHLKKNASVIDCGAGSGFFSLPLSHMGYRMTAVEPSRAMIDIMESKIRSTALPPSGENGSIEIVNCQWEEYTGKGADYCICIHAIYPMNNPLAAIRKMASLCDRTLLLARDLEKTSLTISDRIRRQLDRHGSSKRAEVDAASLLSSERIAYTSETITQTRISTFTDLEKETEYYLFHLKLPRISFERVKEVLTDISSKTSSGYEIEQVYHDVLYIF